jgi:protein gp37
MENKNFWDKGIQLVDGCTKVSPGCKNCWSEAMTARFKRVPEVITNGKFNGKLRHNFYLLEKALDKCDYGTVISLWNDLYNPNVPDEFVKKVMQRINQYPEFRILIITKRIERAVKMGLLTADHVWHIVTCEDQQRADERIPHLLRIPGKRGIIIEPMLGAITLKFSREIEPCPNPECDEVAGCCICEYSTRIWGGPTIHQVILGPENGPGKRPFKEEWAESVKAQCEAAGVPFYRKDTGEGILAWRMIE